MHSNKLMTAAQGHRNKVASFSAAFFLAIGPISTIELSHSAYAAYDQKHDEMIVSQEQDPKNPDTPNQADSVATKASKFAKQVQEYNNGKIAKLRGTNQGFSIAFIVTGITLTLVSTALGAVESQNPEVKKWTKFAIVGLGAGAVAAQALNSAFPVTKRAAIYAGTESELTILGFKAEDITTQDQLNKSKDEFYNLIRSAGNAESQEEKPKKN